ncbi:hypothetical protein COY48_02695 [Candidatus Collierbacteria bacterium CG_4_10_14_0_8_um_filter_43_86]|uniref:Uncharacterized protein n=1 Tax=Candidatus Collierbacteria bacterium CG_4_9_14_3_um_filter_43_16 TaxID=1974532 RepID=A0A2M8BV76_9BACT|nr:MAG: hypothetical protein COY48_02695 [Candidatus Collierbacteria bacterium CG_4_10_14_0_8_um_filter_43_86]PJB47753.1 MAG: hypothetical protein CO104_02950 [Candidatus Collierbacteria bacterium CG_4_9_14_3_um_filter_43_16]
MDMEKIQVPNPTREEISVGFKTALEKANTEEVKTAIESAIVTMEERWKVEDEVFEAAKKAAVTAELAALRGEVPPAVMDAINVAMEEPSPPASTTQEPASESHQTPVDTMSESASETPVEKTEQEMRVDNTEKFIKAAGELLENAKRRALGFLQEAKKIDIRNPLGWALIVAGTQSVFYAWAATLPALSGGNEFVQTAGMITSSAIAALELGASYVLFKEEFKVRSTKTANTSQQ